MTFWELEVRSKEDSRRRIRAARSNPPGGAGLERSTVFDAALEQAQQQFVAAAGDPNASVRPDVALLRWVERQSACRLTVAWRPSRMSWYKLYQFHSA